MALDSADLGANVRLVRKGHLEPVLVSCWISSFHAGLQGGGRCAIENESETLELYGRVLRKGSVSPNLYQFFLFWTDSICFFFFFLT